MMHPDVSVSVGGLSIFLSAVRTLESRRLAALVDLMFPQTLPSQEHARTVWTRKRLNVLSCPLSKPEN